MPKTKAAADSQKKERKRRAQEWKLFRKNNMLSQRRLAGVVGISRRTIQQIEGAHIIPHAETLRRFTVFKAKYDANQKS